MSSPAGPAENGPIERLKCRARDFYFRTDWVTVTVLTAVAAVMIGMFFIVIALGEYRMNR